MPAPGVLEQPDGWQHLQNWFRETNDPIRPWNVSAISRHLQMPQPTIRALLQGPKDSPGMIRTAFTAARLRKLQKLFKSYGYQPLLASRHSTPESLPKETALLSPPVRATQ